MRTYQMRLAQCIYFFERAGYPLGWNAGDADQDLLARARQRIESDEETSEEETAPPS